jgi:opacity protein-like surface antigen
VTIAASAAAQDAPPISFRPFADVSFQRFTATDTFTSVFGKDTGWFYGGGLEVAFRDRIYVDVSAARFKENGERVFRDSTGHVFDLGIPLTATITPLELVGGYRFHPHRVRWLVPYAGAGVGWYRYEETSSFAAAGDNVDTRKPGFVAQGGAEFRIHKWIGVAADVQYTRVTGILGSGGISADLGENDLGGVAGRIKIVVGK